MTEPSRSSEVSITLIAEIIGDTATLALVAARGGRRVYIPKAPKPTHELTQFVGMEAARRLARVFGGLEPAIPLHYTPDARVIGLIADGHSAAQVAEILGRSERFVFSVKARARERGELPPQPRRGYDPDQIRIWD